MTISIDRPINDYPDKTGTTSASYVEAAAVFEGLGATFVIQNTAGTNGLKYKADIFLTPDQTVGTNVVSETTLAHSTTSALITGINVPFFKAVVSVIVAITNTTTYKISMTKY